MSDIKVKDEIVVNKTGVWYFAAEILKKYGIKNTGGNQYVVMCWLKNNNGLVIKNDFIQRNSKVKVPSSKIDVLQIFCKKLRLNKKASEYFDLMECDHEVDGAIEVAKYIVEEIKTNVKSKEASYIADCLDYEKYIRKYYNKNGLASLPDPISVEGIGITKWISMVNTNKPWDHKKKIQERFGIIAVKDRPFLGKNKQLKFSQLSYHKYQYHDYFLDVWSNIHYGFVGRYCGFSEKTLLTGSDFQQAVANIKNANFKGGDDQADKITMQLGMDLYTRYKDKIEKLTYQIILDELEKLDTIGQSRLLHKCFDTSEDGVTYL